MKPYIITIARQYGSGGKTVGKMLADKLGIPFYNREIITMASEDSGVNAMLFSDERLKGDFLTRLRAHYHGNAPVPNASSKSYLKDEALFAYQVKIIRRLADQVHISVGHTCSDYETAYRAFSQGADHVTHFFNAMPPFTHRAPGVFGAAFDAKHVMPELICDGIHIDASAVRVVFSLFGAERMILISDSMMATGMEDGAYSLGGLPVTVRGNLATLEDGTIAGSATNLMDCMRKAVSMGIPLETAVRAATYNPARAIGAADMCGSITAGHRGDCVLLSKDDLSTKKVIFGGKVVA